MKIVELYITDEEDSGVSQLSLVSQPATHYEWLVFNNTCDGECQVMDHSNHAGEDFSHYLTHSPSIRVENVTEEEYQKFFRPTSSADELSPSEDTSEELVRYFYAVDAGLGPKLIKESRQVCRQFIRANKLYRNEDLVKMSASLSIEDANRKMIPRTKGYPVDLKVWKAGKQCRHIFKKLIISVPEGQTAQEFVSSVPKNANRAFGLKPNRTETQVGPGGTSNRKGFLEGRAGFTQEEDLSPIGFVEGSIVYPSFKSLVVNEPEIKGYSMIVVNGVAGFIGGMADDDYFESDVFVAMTGEITLEKFYNDYPQSAKDDAAMGIKRNEELGNPCGTLVGKNRGQQIASGENLSEETIMRTYSYLSRAQKGFEEARSKGDYEACSYISYMLWGGPSMLNYAERIVNQLQEEMIEEFGCITDLMDKGYGELEARQKCCTSCGSPKPYDRATDNNEYDDFDADDYVEDREMVDGIVDLIIQVEDLEERKNIAYRAIETLTGEGVAFDMEDFIGRIGLKGQMTFGTQHLFKDEMKYEITTVVMEPNRYIPRRHEMTSEVYYVVFSEETIKQMSQKFFKDGNQKQFNLEHTDKKLYGGYVYESWLVTNPDMDKAKSMGFNVNKGTWMMTAKWDDKEEFDKYILNGETIGISLEGGFLSRAYSEENFSIIGEMDGEPIFSTEQEALERAKAIGCVGLHKHGDGYMACESHDINESLRQGLYKTDYDVFIDEVRELINKHEN